jgi:F-type H+-transporting ATPase subunit b
MWLTLTFVLLYVLVARVIMPRMSAIFAARAAKVAGDMGEATRLKEEADQVMAAYENALAEGRARAQAIAAETRSRLNAESDQRRHVLEGELNAKIGESERTIAATKTAAMRNVGTIARDAAAAIVERLIGKSPAPGEVDAAVDAALKGRSG